MFHMLHPRDRRQGEIAKVESGDEAVAGAGEVAYTA